jgi:succinoglycan biosynthesis protein ExoA
VQKKQFMYEGNHAELVTASGTRVRVSVIMPVFNEGPFIAGALRSLQGQLTPNFDLEILVIDGMSTDDTCQKVKEVCAQDSRLRLLRNPSRYTPAALNLGLRSARGEYVGILGAHASYDPDYIAVCLQELLAHDAAGCSGKLITAPTDASFQARLVAWTMAHPFASSSRSVRTQPEGYADTVPFPVMQKRALLAAGGYNERLVRNQDNDMNQRLRASGLKLYLTAKTRCVYYARSDIKSFLKHAFSSGLWNAWSLKQNPECLSLRHFAPLAFVTLLLILASLALGSWATGTGSRTSVLLLAAIFAAHLGAGAAAGVVVGLREKTAIALWLAPLILAFHCAYGLGMLRGFLRRPQLLRIARQQGPHESSKDYA